MSKTMTEEPIYLGHPDPSRKIFQLQDAVGRMSVGPDIAEFDLLPTKTAYIDPQMEAGDDVMLGKGGGHHGGGHHGGWGGGWGGPVYEAFPVYMDALELYQDDSAPQVARIDTEDSYRDYVGDRATAEIDKRVSALEAAVREHAADPNAHAAQRSTILGAAESISKMRNATTEAQALDAMEQVPVDAPAGVRAWKDGDGVVVCSIRFCAADGSPRVATMADSVVGGNAPLRARNLVKKTAAAALRAQRRADVVFGAGPVVLIHGADPSRAPLAALMHVKKLADGGHPQASREYATIKAASKSPMGQKVAAPMIAEAERRLSASRPGLLDKIADKIKEWLS